MRAQPTVEGIEHNHGAMRYQRNSFIEATAGIGEERAVVNTTTAATVESEVLIEPVRWSVVSAGVVAALSALVLLGVLAGALGLGPNEAYFLPPVAYDNGPAVLVAAVIGFLSFVFGGWVGARLAVYRSYRTGLLSGALVWGVAVPLLMFAGRGAPHSAAPAGVEYGPVGVQHVASVVLALLVAALVGSLIGGVLGGHRAGVAKRTHATR
jgi:hypothetical protein